MLFLSTTNYIGHPELILRGTVIASLVAAPVLLLWIRRRLASQFLLSNMVVPLFLLYTPFVSPLVGMVMTPWTVWRLSWLLPSALVVSYVLYAVGRWLLEKSSAIPPLGRYRTVVGIVPLVLVALLLVVPSGNVDTMERLTSFDRNEAVDLRFLRSLNDEFDFRDRIILAHPITSSRVAAILPQARVVQHRWEVHSSLFPRSELREALARVKDVRTFFKNDGSVEETSAILERWNVDYVIAGEGAPAYSRLTASHEIATPVYADGAYHLFRVDLPEANADAVSSRDGER